MFVVLLSLGVTAAPALAQDTSTKPGTISGVVVDKKNGKSLPGANVSIKGTTTGTTTDLKGRYRLTGVEAGTYKILFSFVGFQDKTITGVTVKPGETTTLDVTMAEKTAQLDEVVVEAEAARDSEAGMLKDRAKAASVSNAISAEAMSRSGAGDAASAMGNVTGASVVEGKYVNVRGLQGRYVDVQLNGTTLPSADPDGNSVALDIFPSGVIDNIVTSKTFTPDKPGTFTGGAIDITTKAFPSDFFLNASVSSSFNSLVGVGGNILRPPEGLSAVPSAANNENLPPRPRPSNTTANDALNDLTQAFATPVAPNTGDVLTNRSAEMAFGNQFSVFGDRPLGVIASLSYDKSFSGYDGVTKARYSQAGIESESLNPIIDYTTRRGVEETFYGGLAGLSFQLNPKNEFGLRLLHNQGEEQEAITEAGFLENLSGDRRFQTRTARVIERSIWSGELDGTHQFGEGKDGIQVEWKTALSQVNRDEPDSRFFSNQFIPTDTDTSYSIAQSFQDPPTRYFRDLTEQSWTSEASAEIPIGSVTLETGGSFRTRTREFRERIFQHERTFGTTFNGDPDAYVNEQAGRLADGSFGTYVTNATEERGNYDADQQTGAGYLMVETPVPGVSSLEFIGGVRVERTTMSLNTIEVEGAAGTCDNCQGEFAQTDVLPSANLVWSLREDMNLRFAYGRTIALPSFREFAPFQSFSFLGDFTERGNPNLERTSVHNFDLRWEWFPRAGELLSASVYYKDFTDPIERTFDLEAADADIITYANRSSATVYGLELEAQKRLDQLADWLEHVQVGGNLTLTQSSIQRTDGVLQRLRGFKDNPDETRQLQGQSPYIVNLNAGYDNPDSGTSINVFFNRFGDRLDTVAGNGVDIFERARSTLDINASQRVLNSVTLKASVKNVLNTDTVISQEFKGREFVNDRIPVGRTVSVGVSYSY